MARRWEIAFVVPYATPLLLGTGSTGGAETQLVLLAHALRARGRRVALATFDAPGGLPASVDGIDLVALPPRPTTGRTRAALVATLLRHVDADVLVQRAAGSYTGVVGLVARARRRRFVYSTASDFDFDAGFLDHDRTARRLFPIGIRCAHAIVVQTDAQARLCEQRWQRDCTVVRSIAAPAPARDEPPQALLWAGRATDRKRPEAFVELARRLPQARFRMVCELPRQLREQAAGVANLEVLAPLSQADLGRLIDRAVAVVSTSVKEGMPNVFLEAWARGVPALALSHDPDGVIERHELGRVAGDSPERLAQLASNAWELRSDQRAIAARCRAYVARVHGADEVAAGWERALGLSPVPAA